MSRTKNTFLNARVNIIFYAISLILSFYSRKVFLAELGVNFIGLNGTISNLLAFLNLSDLGVGTAITYFLFNPLASKNHVEISNIISLLKFYYKKTGIYIIGIGCLLSLFFPYIFQNKAIEIHIVYITYFTFLIVSFFEYYFNYLQLILIADQKNYLKTIFGGGINILKVIAQLFALFYFENKIYWFLFIEFIFSILKIFSIKYIVKKCYSFLNVNIPVNQLLSVKKEVWTKTKQIFSHQIAGYILMQTDQLLIFSFTSLGMVTYFGNYSLLLSKVTSLLDQFLNSSTASIGNLVVAADINKTKKVFGELMVLRYWISGAITFTCYLIIPPFISIWLGSKYILSSEILILLLANNYILMTRQPIDAFLYAFGIFNDTWATWTEALLNLSISIIAGYYYGIIGILLGTFISMLLIVVIWKPFLLYTRGFKVKVKTHWLNMSIYLLSFISSAIIINNFLPDINFSYFTNALINIFVKSIVLSGLFLIIYFIHLIIFTKSMKNLIQRFRTLISI